MAIACTVIVAPAGLGYTRIPLLNGACLTDTPPTTIFNVSVSEQFEVFDAMTPMLPGPSTVHVTPTALVPCPEAMLPLFTIQ